MIRLFHRDTSVSDQGEDVIRRSGSDERILRDPGNIAPR